MNKVSLWGRIVARRSLLGRALTRWFAGAFGIATAVLTFMGCDDLGLGTLPAKLVALLAVAATALVGAVGETLARRERTLWSCGANAIKACYGDVFDLAGGPDHPTCVIPVNTAFDTIVDPPSAGKPLVSSNSLHGRWVKFLEGGGMRREQIDGLISKGLEGHAPTNVLDRGTKPRGRLEEYEVGTVCPIRCCGMSFLLVALSRFDVDNRASSSLDCLVRCLGNALAYHDLHGQAGELLLPLMGTASSRLKMSQQDSFDVISSVLKAHGNENEVNGTVRIVVYDGDADEVSIW